MTSYGRDEAGSDTLSSLPLRALTPEQVMVVDRALASIGSFGEVRLVKVKGQLRFIQQLESRDLQRNRWWSGGD